MTILRRVGTAFAVVIATLAFTITACAPASTTEDTAPPPGISNEVAPEPSMSDEQIFLTVLRENTSSWDGETDYAVLELAEAMCGAWDRGATFEDIAVILVDSGYDPYEAGFFIGAGTEAVCPEYSDEFEESLA